MIAALLLLAQAAPIAPPLPQERADCSRPTYATDQLVCGDPALRALDNRMTALLAGTPPSSRWIEDQQDWFSRSRRCAFRVDRGACVTAAYRERIAVLAALGGTPPSPAGDCSLAEGARASLARSDDAALLVVDGAVAAVALPSAPAWTPFVDYRTLGGAVAIRTADGALIARCRREPR